MTDEQINEAINTLRGLVLQGGIDADEKALDLLITQLAAAREAVANFEKLFQRARDGEGDVVIRATSEGYLVGLDDGNTDTRLIILSRDNRTPQSAVAAAAAKQQQQE